MPRNLTVPFCCPTTPATITGHRCNLRYGARMDIGYGRVSTVKQDLTRQLDALATAGIKETTSTRTKSPVPPQTAKGFRKRCATHGQVM